MPFRWWIIPAFAAAAAIALLAAGALALLRRRPIRGMGGVLSGGALLMAAVAALLLGLNAQTYQRLSYERPVATVSLHRTGEHSFGATIVQHPNAPSPGGEQRFTLTGDEWRIEARVLKWKPWANLLGLDSRYRLTRLAGEYTDPALETNAPRAVHELGAPAENAELAQLGKPLMKWAVFDTLYGSAALMPMADGAAYEVWLSQSGLVARPANDAAVSAVGQWR